MARNSGVFDYLASLLRNLLNEGMAWDQKRMPVEWIDATKQQLSSEFGTAIRVAGDDVALAQKTHAAKRLAFEFAEMLAERTTQPTADYRKTFNELSELEYELRYLDDATPIILRYSRFTLADDYDAGSKQTEATGNLAKLRPCDNKAFSQYRSAIRDNPELTTDRAAYDWFVKNLADDGENLPTFATWGKYLRLARTAAGEQKNKRGVGNETRSVVSATRLDQQNRTEADRS